jgi:Tfp pilus assembly protein PilF
VLEVTANDETRSCPVQVGGERPAALTVSYNANLTSAERYRSLGHQYLARGNAAEAKAWLERAWREQPTDATRIELCRIAALTGQYDAARTDLKAILDRGPDNFEALTVLAYIEVQLQDTAVAERLYSRALEIHSSPAVAKALAELRRRAH